MKKLFISCPMKGRTPEAIEYSIDCMHKIAEIAFGEELEVIPSYIPNRAPDTTNRRIWYLGESIKMMSQADYFIGINYSDFYDGCYIEGQVAQSYGIPTVKIDMCGYSFLKDALECEQHRFDNLVKERSDD